MNINISLPNAQQVDESQNYVSLIPGQFNFGELDDQVLGHPSQHDHLDISQVLPGLQVPQQSNELPDRVLGAETLQWTNRNSQLPGHTTTRKRTGTIKV